MKAKQKGYMIIETGIYLTVLLVLLGVGYSAMYRCIDRSVALRRNADALTSALQAGEHWRADVRVANAPIKSESREILRIPTARGEIIYRFETNAVLRRAPSNSWVRVLADVKNSQMQPDPREHVTAWRWEIELLPVKKDTANTNRLHPLFTFVAVPTANIAK